MEDLAMSSLAQVVPTAALIGLERRCAHADRCGRRQVTLTTAEARALAAEVRMRRAREENHRVTSELLEAAEKRADGEAQAKVAAHEELERVRRLSQAQLEHCAKMVAEATAATAEVKIETARAAERAADIDTARERELERATTALRAESGARAAAEVGKAAAEAGKAAAEAAELQTSARLESALSAVEYSKAHAIEATQAASRLATAARLASAASSARQSYLTVLTPDYYTPGTRAAINMLAGRGSSPLALEAIKVLANTDHSADPRLALDEAFRASHQAYDRAHTPGRDAPTLPAPSPALGTTLQSPGAHISPLERWASSSQPSHTPHTAPDTGRSPKAAEHAMVESASECMLREAERMLGEAERSIEHATRGLAAGEHAVTDDWWR